MAVYEGKLSQRVLRLFVIVLGFIGLNNPLFTLPCMCVEKQSQLSREKPNALFAARPVFVTASGTQDEMLLELLEYEKTVEWKEFITTVNIPAHVYYEFYSLEGRLLAVLPGADEYWPFIHSWLADREIDLECSSVEQLPMNALQPANYGGLYSLSGFAAPYIRYSIDKNRAAYIVFDQAETTNSMDDDLLNWEMMYTVEVADESFPEQADWDLSLHGDGVLASWIVPPHEEPRGTANEAPMAAWLVFRGKDIVERLLPALNGIKSFQFRPAIKYRSIRHEDSRVVEEYMSLPRSESGCYRICFSVYRKNRRQAAELQEVVTDVSAWPAAHVGVFSMGDKGWLLLLFEGVDEE